MSEATEGDDSRALAAFAHDLDEVGHPETARLFTHLASRLEEATSSDQEREIWYTVVSALGAGSGRPSEGYMVTPEGPPDIARSEAYQRAIARLNKRARDRLGLVRYLYAVTRL